MKHKLVYLEWCDALASEDGWQTIEAAKEWAKNEDWIVKECGFLIEETKEYFLFAGRIGDYNSDYAEKYGSIMKVPKTWIRKRIDLTKYIRQ